MALGFPAFDQALAIIRSADWEGLEEMQTMIDSQKKIKALLDNVGDRERDLLKWRDRMFEESKKD